MGIAQVMEGRRVLEHLTVEENLLVGAYSRKDKDSIKSDLEMVYQWFPKLKDMRKRVSGYLSGGEQQMLVIGRALMARPKLMLLDEPSLGLAPLVVREIYEIIYRINKEMGMSILLVEQNAKMALEVAHYGYILENGRIVMEGKSDVLKDSEMIKDFYLGISTSNRISYKKLKRADRAWML
jgi:branched-chain amino acid transport system ATP-binding protein